MNTTGDLCDGEISVLNHYLSWSKFINTTLYRFRQWFNPHLSTMYASNVISLTGMFGTMHKFSVTSFDNIIYHIYFFHQQRIKLINVN